MNTRQNATTVTRFDALSSIDFLAQGRSLGVEAHARALIEGNARGEYGCEFANQRLLQLASEQRRAAESTYGAVPAFSGARTAGRDTTDGEAVVEAIYARATYKTPTERARRYMNHTLLDIACERAGLNPRQGDTTVILRAANTSSDFPQLIEAAANKVLLDRYQTAAPSYRAIAKRRDLKDFKVSKLLRIGDFPMLEKYQENGEIKTGTINESGEEAVLASYGRVVRLTRQAIVNDDLGAFADIFSSLGSTVALFENATFFAMKGTIGPLLSDGKALFHTDHGNLAASSTAITVPALTAARQAIRTQKNIDGLVLNIQPKILFVGADKETEADQVTATLTPATATDANPFGGTLSVVAEGAISGNAWEVYADPNSYPAWYYGHLASAPGPRVLTEQPLNFDGMAWRVTLDFYAAPSDYRPAYRNPGA